MGVAPSTLCWLVLAGANETVLQRARNFLQELTRWLEQATTWEARVAFSVGLLLVAFLVAVIVVPRLLRGLWRASIDRLFGDRVAGGFEVLGEYVPTTIGGIVLRSVQLVIFVITVISMLVVWGLADVAVDVLIVIGLSIPFLLQISITLVLVLLVFVGSDILEESIGRFSKGADRITEHQEEVLLRVGQLGLLAFIIAGALTVWGINLSGLLVGAGFLGIVVGLAARQTLGSLIAGLVLMFSRPFTIGDWIRIGEEEGIVTEITIFTTRLENFDGEFVVLPNDMVNNAPITNRSKKGHLRIKIDVGIDYDADPEHAQDVALEAIDSVDLVEPAPPPQVIPKAFGDSAVVLEMRFWIDRPTPPRMWQATARVVTAVKGAFEAEGIKIPFPQREMSGRAETGGFRVHGAAEEIGPAADERSRAAEGDGGRDE